MKFEEICPTTSQLVSSIAKLHTLTKDQMTSLMNSYTDCCVGEAHHGVFVYKNTCPKCRYFAIQFADYVQCAYHKEFFCVKNSKYWLSYRVDLFNWIRKQTSGYTYDDQSFTKLKADFAAHFTETHGTT